MRKKLGSGCLAFVLLLPTFWQAVSAQTLESVPLNLHSQISRTHVLKPSISSITASLTVDSTPSMTLVFGSASKTLDIDLLTPGGQTIPLGAPATAQVLSGIYPDPSDAASTGANYVFTLKNPEPGTWTYTVHETVAFSTDRIVLLNLTLSSPVRAAIAGGGEDYRLDRDVSLALVTTEGTQTLKGLSINASLDRVDAPGFAPVALNFRDDGSAGDTTAGDGLYTATFQPGLAGEFQVYATLTGLTSSGQSFQRTASATFRVKPPAATFLRTFVDRGIDLDGDGLLDQIGVTPHLDIQQAGKYKIAVTLKASNNTSLTASLVTDLGAGAADPEVLFETSDIRQFLAVNGPYEVSEVLAEKIDEEPILTADEAFSLGETAAYEIDALQHEAIELRPGAVAEGVDTNSNSRYDILRVSLPIEFLYAGFYRWSARLVDANGTEVALAAGSGSFSAGHAILLLEFDGSLIGKNGVNGPYFVRNLIIYGGGRSAVVDTAFTTPPFPASQFEGFVSQAASDIPTLGQWGLILLALGLVTSAVLLLRRGVKPDSLTP
jgi:hypothetical protein